MLEAAATRAISAGGTLTWVYPVVAGRLMRKILLATAYIIWTGIGAVGVFLISIILLGGPVNAPRIVAPILIGCGFAPMKLLSACAKRSSSIARFRLLCYTTAYVSSDQTEQAMSRSARFLLRLRIGNFGRKPWGSKR